MEPSRIRNIALTLAVVGAFAFWIWSGIGEVTQVGCEVCVEFQGQRSCRRGIGANEEKAVRVAQSTACAPLTSGVTEGFACERLAPVSRTCRERAQRDLNSTGVPTALTTVPWRFPVFLSDNRG